MDTVLGLFGMVVWIVSVIAIAAAVTFIVVRITPGDESAKPTPEA
jgi:hypothetical protein